HQPARQQSKAIAYSTTSPQHYLEHYIAPALPRALHRPSTTYSTTSPQHYLEHYIAPALPTALHRPSTT
ncbi:hypothetical protein BgiBS90_000699, partial [Biomphalaria glabrata]